MVARLDFDPLTRDLGEQVVPRFDGIVAPRGMSLEQQMAAFCERERIARLAAQARSNVSSRVSETLAA